MTLEIILGVIGALIGLLGLVTGYFFYKRGRKKQGTQLQYT